MTDEPIATETIATEQNILRCTCCDTVVSRLHSAPATVRSLSLGREVRAGDLICDRCLLELQEEREEEEAMRGPR